MSKKASKKSIPKKPDSYLEITVPVCHASNASVQATPADMKVPGKHGELHLVYDLASRDLSFALRALASLGGAASGATIEIVLRVGDATWRMFGKQQLQLHLAAQSHDAMRAKRAGAKVEEVDFGNSNHQKPEGFFDHVNKAGHRTRDMFGNID